MKKCQKQKILEHLQVHGSITSAEAVGRFRCYRLAARISELREAGHNIVTEHADGDGNPVNYAIYRLIKEEKDA